MTWLTSRILATCFREAQMRSTRLNVRRGWLKTLGASVAVMAITLACGNSKNGFDDGDSSIGTPVDASVPFDSPSLLLDTGTSPSNPDSSSSTDAAFSFDGFAKADGASYCLDDDGDGWTTCDGDCNDHDSLINPCAFDTNAASGDPVGSDGIDNDCDGQIDNRILCDGSLAPGHSQTPGDYPAAMDLCDNTKCTVVQNAVFYGPNSTLSKRITSHMGASFVPHMGSYMAFLSTGIADDRTDTPTYRPGDGTDLQNTFTHPSPLTALQNTNPCGSGQDESTVPIHDYTEVRLTLVAPINAGSFTFDFNFFSAEYPAYACRGYNDTFLVMLTSKQYTTPYQIALIPKAVAST